MEERICNKCNISVVGDEYCVILEYSNVEISHTRNTYLPEYCRKRPNRDKFIVLKQSKNVTLLYNLV